MRIVQAQPADAHELTKIAFAAKAYWGYPKEWMEKWREELTVTPTFIESNRVFKLMDGENHIAGFGGTIDKEPDLWIEHLWLLPPYIGKGLGKKLYQHLLEQCIRPEHGQLKLLADPNAKPFYEKMGFQIIEQVESWPKGRYLPLMALEL